MDTLVKADIFFFVSSIATVILTLLLSILLFYFIKAGKNLYDLSEKLKDNFEGSENYILELKDRLEGNILFRLLFPLIRQKKYHEKPNEKRSKKRDEENSKKDANN